MKTWIYSWLVYPTLYVLARVVGCGSPKVRETLKLRSWKHFLSLRFNAGEPIEYWIHVASAGELEYALPVVSELGRRGKRVLITYYSVSAKGPVEKLRDTFSNVSLVVPLPHDGLGLMKEFVELVYRHGVRHLLLLKYELWPGLLGECNRLGIKVILIDALKPSWFHKKLLHKLDGILAGYSSEVQSLPHHAVKVVGDTRVERVLQRLEQNRSRLDQIVGAKLREALKGGTVLVCGSMWPPDTRLVLEGLASLSRAGHQVHVVWVPHELDPAEARKAESSFRELGYQVCDLDGSAALQGSSLAIIVMKKGILAELYRLGELAYVGGAFGSGVHSVWEPALCGARVACGPGIERSPEAGELSERNWLQVVRTPQEFEGWVRDQAARKAEQGSGQHPLADLLKEHVGASRRIVDFCEEGA